MIYFSNPIATESFQQAIYLYTRIKWITKMYATTTGVYSIHKNKQEFLINIITSFSCYNEGPAKLP